MAQLAKESKELNKDQIAILREKLESEKERLIFKDAVPAEDLNLKKEDLSDEVDQANADTLNAQQLRFRNREVFYEKKLVEALRRLERDEYGYCEECGEPIGFSRLMARPTADKCIACKEESERDESNNIYQRQSKSYGKSVDLAGAGL